MHRVIRDLVPPSLKHRVTAVLARADSRRLDRQLAKLAAGSDPIVAGPWLGEVGFELLYWVPFLAWFADRYAVDPSRLLVISRGGTAGWYRPFAAEYRDVLDYLTPEAFKAEHDARLRELGQQKQVRRTPFERELIERMLADAAVADTRWLHPEVMYRIMRPFWWGHLDERWVHRHAIYRRLPPPSADLVPGLPSSYVAVKFYFNDCFPATERNRAFARQIVRQLAAGQAVVSLSSGITLDDHGCYDIGATGAIDVAGGTPPRYNLQVQSAIVARATAFVGTYGGFAYLAPFYGVRSVSYYDDADGFSRSHLRMVRSALDGLGGSDLLEVQRAGGELTLPAHDAPPRASATNGMVIR